MPSIALSSEVDWAGFSHAVRSLRAAGVAPADVQWRIAFDAGRGPQAPDGGDLFEAPATLASRLPDAPALKLPKAFVDPAREVFLHADPDRHVVLHRLACRVADNVRAWADPLDPDRLRFEQWRREVHREMHKMKAFVRFRQVTDDDGALRHVAWFEPIHHVVEATAPFFARRFTNMRWAILTPRVSVQWDGERLDFMPGSHRSDAPDADAGESLWLAYYRSIFNPGRVKVAMMKKEMPVRYWTNLPEAAQIGSMLAEAPTRTQRMIDGGGVARVRRKGGLAGIAVTAVRPASGGATGAIAHGGPAARLGDDGCEPTADIPSSGGHAASPADLPTLQRAAARCQDCPVADVATQTVWGEGDAGARLMLVGEQPGDQEDLRGRPFVGPAGQLLHGAFDELGWDARKLYLTNAVKHFHHELRGKRRMHKTPAQREVQACNHWLEAEIAAIRPEALIALGATAARALLGRDVPIGDNEGRWLRRADGLPVLVCRHPSAILRADEVHRTAMRRTWIEALSEASPLALSASSPTASLLDAPGS